MKREEFEQLLRVALEATHEQQSQPLLMALAVIVTELCQDARVSRRLAAAFLRAAETCPPDVSGRKYLEALVELAGDPMPLPPNEPRGDLRSRLRLIRNPNKD